MVWLPKNPSNQNMVDNRPPMWGDDCFRPTHGRLTPSGVAIFN